MKNMNRSTIGVVAAVVLALVGGLLLWRSSGTSETEAAQAPAEQVQVLVAARDIDRGVAAADMAENAFAFVQVAEVPADQVLPNALRSVDDLADLGLGRNVTVAVIPMGAQVTPDSFIVPGDQQRTAIEAAENLFQITISLEPQRALGGTVVPGQTVAVIGSFDAQGEDPGQTLVILDEVEVTNVQAEALLTPEQQALDPLAPSLAPNSRMNVTLGVEIDDLERLAYAVEFGRIWLADQGDEAVVDGSEVRDRENVVIAIPEQDRTSVASGGE